MVYTKWTIAMWFLFEYRLDPKDHESEEEYKAVAVESAIWPEL